MRAHEIEIVITSADFRAGQAAAQADAIKGSSGPGPGLAYAAPEFQAGYRYEWREYVAPFRSCK